MNKEKEKSINIYKKCLEALPMPVLLVGADEHILFMNKSYGDFLGIEPEAAIGKHVYEVIENSRTPLVLKTQTVTSTSVERSRDRKLSSTGFQSWKTANPLLSLGF